MAALLAALPPPARDFALARVAQALAAAERVQAGLVAAELLSPGVDARWAIALVAYAAWWAFKLTVLRRLLPALLRLFERVPALHVPLTPDEADATPKGRKWVSNSTSFATAWRRRAAAGSAPRRRADARIVHVRAARHAPNPCDVARAAPPPGACKPHDARMSARG